jgi:cyclopropane fatty-acyl-phospholipid synthase-like methyltransferase
MAGINNYGMQLSQEDIAEKKHRAFIGGLWEEIGRLQFEFLKARGLKPAHKLLDIGCGCLRGGIHFISYLEEGNYYGLDVNRSLIEAGLLEAREAGLLESKKPNLVVDDQFRLGVFGEMFDFMLSLSLFTHLPMNIIVRCLSEAKKCLKPGGVYFSTFFQAPSAAYLDELEQYPAVITKYDSDPYHYSIEELLWMASISGLEVEFIGDWGHPKNQKMAAFSVK